MESAWLLLWQKSIPKLRFPSGRRTGVIIHFLTPNCCDQTDFLVGRLSNSSVSSTMSAKTNVTRPPKSLLQLYKSIIIYIRYIRLAGSKMYSCEVVVWFSPSLARCQALHSQILFGYGTPLMHVSSVHDLLDQGAPSCAAKLADSESARRWQHLPKQRQIVDFNVESEELSRTGGLQCLGRFRAEV